MEVIWDLVINHGWQAVVIALFTFIAIECIKPLARKLIKKENIRHILYVGCNYAFTLLFAFLLSLILGDVATTFKVFAPAIVVVNVLAPIISSAGFWNWLEGVIAEAFEKYTENGAWKKALRELVKACGVDEKILDMVATKVENEYLPLIKKGANIFLNENRDEFILNIKQKLAGFVSNEKLQEVAEKLFDKLVESWTPKEEPKKEIDEVVPEEMEVA